MPIPANMQNERSAGNIVVAPMRKAQTSVTDVTRIETPYSIENNYYSFCFSVYFFISRLLADAVVS